MDSFDGPNYLKQNKVVFIIGATGTGKTKLSIDLALHFHGEIINCDKIQVYRGLDILTNKATESERQGVPHHLLGVVEDPDVDFSAFDFCSYTMSLLKEITDRQRVPIIVGGSNSFIKELMDDPTFDFRSSYTSCFLWMHVWPSVLEERVSKRVDEMVTAGLMDEVRGIFVPQADYTRGIRRAIGVPEMDRVLRMENEDHVVTSAGSGDEEEEEEEEEKMKHKETLLEEAINEVKVNTYKLACRQVEKIQRLRDEDGWEIHRLDATRVFEADEEGEAAKAWKKLVLEPSLGIVSDFLLGYKKSFNEDNGFSATLTEVCAEVSTVD